MIKVTFHKNNGVIETIKINGHADYDISGKDIVCASASSMLITTVNAIIEFDKNAIEYVESNNFSLNNIKKDEITNKLLNNLISMLEELENNYRNNIEIKEE